MWLLSTALAADLVLATDRVAVGVARDGSFGSAALGLLADPDGADGPIPVGGDWIDWGEVYEGWVVSVDGRVDVHLAAWGESDGDLTWDPPGAGSLAWRHGAAEADGYTVDVWIAAPWGAATVWVTTVLTPAAPLEDVVVARLFDPDPDAWSTGSYAARVTLDGGIATAESPSDGRAVALGGLDGQAGVCAWCTDPAALTETVGADPVDDQLGVRVALGDLPLGVPATVSFVYTFGDGAADAADAATHALVDPDPDADGAAGPDDCAPWDDTVGAGLPETADGRDNDCDGAIDEDLPDPGTTESGWAPTVAASTSGTQTAACAAAPTPPAALLTALAALAAVRRRR